MAIATPGSSPNVRRSNKSAAANDRPSTALPAGIGNGDCARIVRALSKQPDMVAGTGRFTTDFLAAGRGRWIGKEGAEGVYCVGLRAAARGGKAIGIAFKIEDGSARPRDAVTLAALDRLGALPLEARRALAPYAEPPVQNALGLEVGRIEADVPIASGGRRGSTGGGARRAKR